MKSYTAYLGERSCITSPLLVYAIVLVVVSRITIAMLLNNVRLRDEEISLTVLKSSTSCIRNDATEDQHQNRSDERQFASATIRVESSSSICVPRALDSECCVQYRLVDA